VSIRHRPARRLLPLILAGVTLAGIALLLVQDAAPSLFPSRSHEFLAAFSLAAIAFAYVIFQLIHRAPLKELAKAIMLAAAFLFWAANQFWPNLPKASLFNDIAIALFVLDVFWVIKGWPANSKERSFAGDERISDRRGMGCGCACCGRQAG